ncbi:Ig-like protein group 2 [Paenibacillus sp. BK033]|uniref:beta strand repeat-containing protein n=1 Tax=Paenibacillus sp. BK033 TaxID=2512133 RepID=UPI0010518C28|nr:Ig-like domain-containing protein [Paenibacillus sp. BK033]TCM85700.1 Ig-like protein group 2 [Paenibacillus sp. BK033]
MFQRKSKLRRSAMLITVFAMLFSTLFAGMASAQLGDPEYLITPQGGYNYNAGDQVIVDVFASDLNMIPNSNYFMGGSIVVEFDKNVFDMSEYGVDISGGNKSMYQIGGQYIDWNGQIELGHFTKQVLYLPDGEGSGRGTIIANFNPTSDDDISTVGDVRLFSFILRVKSDAPTGLGNITINSTNSTLMKGGGQVIDRTMIQNGVLALNITGASPTITSLTASPSSLALNMGDTAQPITITANWSNGTTTNVTGLADWTISNGNVDFDSGNTFLPISVGTSTINASYNGLSVDIPVTVSPEPAPTLSYIDVVPSVGTLQVGATRNLVVNATWSDNSQTVVTSSTSWVSSDSEIASVDSDGVVTALSAGTATITGTFNGQSGSYTVTVQNPPLPATLVSMVAQPDGYVLNAGSSTSVAVSGTYSDSSIFPISANNISWVSDDPNIATAFNGVVTAHNAGSTTINGSYQGINVTIDVTVNGVQAPTFVGLWSNGTTPTLQVGETYPITLKEVYSDNSKVDIPPLVVTYNSDNLAVANVNPFTGVITANGVGVANITAVYNNLPAVQYMVTVQSAPVQPTLLSMTANPGFLPLVVGQTVTPIITGLYDNASTADLTSQVTWSSTNPATASVDANGVVTAVTPNMGPVSIVASLNGVTVSIPVSVSAAQLTVTSVTIQSQPPSIPVGASGPVYASALRSDNSIITNLGSLATWTSSNPAVLSIDNTGFIEALSVGTSTLTVSYGGQSDSVLVTVVAGEPVLTGLTVSPTSTSLTVGGTRASVVTAVYSDSTTPAVTSQATYTSSNTAVATVSEAGVITAVSAGTATITASFGGRTATVAVTVTPVISGGGGSVQPPVAPVEQPKPPVFTVPVEPTITTPTINTDIFSAEILFNQYSNLIPSSANPSVVAPQGSAAFADVAKGTWSDAAIGFGQATGIIQGDGNGHFNPDAAVTRAEFATMILNAFHIQGTPSTGYADSNSHWASEAINILTSAGVLKGYGDGTFRPDAEISRQEMAAVLSRLINKATPTTNNFNDIAGSWAADSINALSNAGIVNGTGNGLFSPNGDATRAESIQMIYNLIKVLVGQLNSTNPEFAPASNVTDTPVVKQNG